MNQERAAKRNSKYYDKIITNERPKFWDDWRFIWANRTYHGEKRSWVQRLIGW